MKRREFLKALIALPVAASIPVGLLKWESRYSGSAISELQRLYTQGRMRYGKVEAILCSMDLYDRYEGELEQHLMFTDTRTQSMNMPNLTFKGVPAVRSLTPWSRALAQWP